MDIITHTLSGVAVGTGISTFSTKGLKSQVYVILLSGFGGFLPDFDAISLWTKFDKLFGKLFGLTHTGKEIYFSKFWYSHHGFFHSLLASLIISFLIGILLYLVKNIFIKSYNENLIGVFKNHKVIFSGIILGFILHLFGDMPTPSCVWGGVDLFWPSKTYIGGTGEIWWWNNYDIFLIIVGIILINLLIILSKQYLKIDIRKLTISLFLAGSILIFGQIKNRGFDFNYNGYTSNFNLYEQKSKEIQKRILGNRIYGLMVKFDKKIRMNF